MMWGVETPCNGLYASLLCFHSLSSQKFRLENVRKAMANFASIKGAQSNSKCMYCISILLLCRAPIEDREFFSTGIMQLPCPNCTLCLRLSYRFFVSPVIEFSRVKILLTGTQSFSNIWTWEGSSIFSFKPIFPPSAFFSKRLSNPMQQKKGSKPITCFLLQSFTSKMEKHFVFLRKFLLHKKMSSYCLQWWVWQENHTWVIFQVFNA